MSHRNVRHQAKQVGSWHARDRKWVASLALEPEELEARAHIKFERGEDDLGSLKYAFLEFDPATQVLLLKYDNPDLAGTMVWIPADSEDTHSGLHELVDALNLTKSDLLSQAPDSV